MIYSHPDNFYNCIKFYPNTVLIYPFTLNIKVRSAKHHIPYIRTNTLPPLLTYLKSICQNIIPIYNITTKSIPLFAIYSFCSVSLALHKCYRSLPPLRRDTLEILNPAKLLLP